MNQSPEPLQRVIFRKDLGGVIVACLPDVAANPGRCMMYEHVGQHGEGDYWGVVRQTKPARRAEYANLLAELKSIGYNLRVVERLRYD
jgi:hypothetical protein